MHKWLGFIRKRSFTGCASIRMKLLLPETVEAALVDLEKVPVYSQVLLASQVPDDHPGHALFQASVFYPKGVEGKAPARSICPADAVRVPAMAGIG